ncbi:hypothetical protein EV193_10180 [Herbihabitans rhizosphaerae]|uniref:Pirin family protein n=1 Tax=Herbihabitans rhizosphaerae TaxID=1872711 RepID=A0A4Q7L4J7_9PSEU|nr:pirin family protein [Herbihabitans rhizosphaerae]RZS44205.1 hypothetical protein EV193_10180 [Herbihabitans rhizosphaerae]
MPAVTADTLTLPRLPELPAAETDWRPVRGVVKAQKFLEGEGFQVRRPFPSLDLDDADPFLLLDHLGAVEYAPGEAKGAPWHPHRGFETVTYVIDGAVEHTDSIGGGGLITDGATQWMTAGAGILHNEVPPQDMVAKGGLFHAAQLWVNLPRTLKLVTPRYQDIEAGDATLLSSDDGGALVRIIAGSLDGHDGPGSTYTPITYLHATLSPGARLATPWPEHFNAMAYVLSGSGTIGQERRPLPEGHLGVFGQGGAISLRADDRQPANSPSGWEVLIVGGQPINEPVARYGPFVMNTREEIVTAIEDFQAGRLGQIPAEHIAHRTSADEEV